MKRKFLVQFYHGTDNRCEAVVEAFDELGALVQAREVLNLSEWATYGPGFHVRISLA